jgi:hypothetical protein
VYKEAPGCRPGHRHEAFSNFTFNFNVRRYTAELCLRAKELSAAIKTLSLEKKESSKSKMKA